MWAKVRTEVRRAPLGDYRRIVGKAAELFRARHKAHPELEDPGDVEERRSLVESPGKRNEIEALCRGLWGKHKAPEHWSGLRWMMLVEETAAVRARRH